MQNNSRTYEQLTFPFTEDLSTFSREASPASRSAPRGKGRGPKTTATSGPRCSALFGLLDPAGSWARTFTESLVGRKGWCSSRCALTWKRRVTKSNRTYFQLAASTPRTCGTGPGLLPTVQTQGLKTCDGNGKTQFYPVGLLPTPTAIDSGSGRVNRSLSVGAKARPTLAMAYRDGKTSRLNPRFVAEMMGFPPNWTELPFRSGEGKASKPTETP